MQVRPVGVPAVAPSVSQAPREAGLGSRAEPQDAFERTAGKAKAAPHAPEVLELAARYIPRATLERSFARVLTSTAKLDAIIAGSTDPDVIIDAMVAKDARRQIFLTEGLLRLYSERYGAPVQSALERIKQLEDVLGAYVDTRRMTKLASDKKCPLAVVEHLHEAEQKARGELRELIERHWTPRAGDPRVPGLAEMLESFAKLDWDNPKDDRKYIRGEMVKALRKLEDTKFDMRELQTGIHELRRQLRWIPIYVEALDGLVVTDAKQPSHAAYAALTEKSLPDPKYVKLPPPAYDADPIAFPKTLYIATAKYVLDFGDLKDRGEWIEGLADAYRESGEKKSKKKAHKAAVKAFGASDENVTRDAERLYREIKRVGYLELVRRVFAEG